MSLKLDNVQVSEVKNVTDLRVDRIVIDTQSQSMMIIYTKLDVDGNIIGSDVLHTDDYLPFGIIKSKIYDVLQDELGVTGTVS
jgi:hypothetical protein